MSAEIYIALKATISIISLFIFTRIMGKRAIAQLSFFDYVSGISMGAVSGAFILTRDVTIWQGIIALAVLAIFPIILSFISLKSYKGRKILDGSPIVLIQNGKIMESNLKKSKLNINDVLEKCRIKDAFSLAEVEFAILETGGDVSVVKKSPLQPVTPNDLQINTTNKGLSTNLILDGKILWSNLQNIQRDEAWLLLELNKLAVSSVDKVLLGYLDTQNIFHVDLRSNDLPTKILM